MKKQTEQTVNIEQALDITAVFNWNIRSLPLPDLKQPSESFQKLFPEIDPEYITRLAKEKRL